MWSDHELLSFVVFTSPPPPTVATLVTDAATLPAILTVTEIGEYEAPGASTVVVVHPKGDNVQVHVLPPLIAVAVRPDGRVSTTVTVPAVGEPPTFETAKLYVPEPASRHDASNAI